MKCEWYQPREALLSGSVPRKYDPIAQLLKQIAPGRRVLDIGCNAGLVSLLAAQAGASKVTGVEKRPVYVGQANAMLRHWRGEGLIPSDADVTFVEADLRNQPGLVDAHDVFLLIRVIYHLKERVVDLFDRLSKRKDAVVIIQGNPARREKAETDPGPFGNKLALAENIVAFLEERGFETQRFDEEIVVARHPAGTLEADAREHEKKRESADDLWVTPPPRFRNIVTGDQLGDRFRYDRDWVMEQLQVHPSLMRHAKFLSYPEDRADNPYLRAREWTGLADGKVVLDFGCAIAWASPYLKETLPRLTYIGVDINDFALAAASVLFPEADHLYSTTRDAPDLSFLRDDSVDLIIVARLTRYAKSREFFAEFERVLRPGGHLYIETHSSGTLPVAEERDAIVDELESAFDTVRVADWEPRGSLSEFRRSVPKFRPLTGTIVPCSLAGAFRLKDSA